jgi:hypothetical protein
METAMNEFLSRFDTGLLVPLFAIAGSFLIAGISIAARSWQKSREIELKQDMLNRGMSAEEIKMVLEAGSKK